MNLKDFEVAIYRVIVVCLLANKFQGGEETASHTGHCPINLVNVR